MSHKKLAKYEREYRALKQQEADTLDPVERLEVGSRNIPFPGSEGRMDGWIGYFILLELDGFVRMCL